MFQERSFCSPEDTQQAAAVGRAVSMSPGHGLPTCAVPFHVLLYLCTAMHTFNSSNMSVWQISCWVPEALCTALDMKLWRSAQFRHGMLVNLLHICSCVLLKGAYCCCADA